MILPSPLQKLKYTPLLLLFFLLEIKSFYLKEVNDTLSAFSKLNPFGAICILWKPTAECCAQRCNDWLSQHAGGGPITKWSLVNPLVGNALATCNSPPVLTSFLSFVKWHFLGSRFGELVFNNVLRGIFDGSFRKHHMGLTAICHLFLIKGPNLLSLELPIFFYILKAQMWMETY